MRAKDLCVLDIWEELSDSSICPIWPHTWADFLFSPSPKGLWRMDLDGHVDFRGASHRIPNGEGDI